MSVEPKAISHGPCVAAAAGSQFTCHGNIATTLSSACAHCKYARSLATTDRDELASGMYEKFEHAKVPGTTARRCDGDILG